MSSKTQLADPDVYAEVYTHQLPFIQAVILNSGCPPRHLDDVTSEVVLALLNSDGLSRYDPAKASLRTYLANYVVRVARTALKRQFWARESKITELPDELEEEYSSPGASEAFEEFIQELLDATPDRDAQVFILVATATTTYAKVRAELVEMGWDSNRRRRAVRRGRTAVRSCL